MWHKMFKDQYLNIDNLISTPNVLKLFRVVEAHGGVLRFVGGAVRDAVYPHDRRCPPQHLHQGEQSAAHRAFPSAGRLLQQYL